MVCTFFWWQEGQNQRLLQEKAKRYSCSQWSQRMRANPRAEKAWQVRLLFAKEVATYVRERVWHPSQRLRERRDGSLEMRLATSGRKELTRWILSWMPHVRVLAPVELHERVRQRLLQGLAVGDKPPRRTRERGQ